MQFRGICLWNIKRHGKCSIEWNCNQWKKNLCKVVKLSHHLRLSFFFILYPICYYNIISNSKLVQLYIL